MLTPRHSSGCGTATSTKTRKKYVVAAGGVVSPPGWIMTNFTPINSTEVFDLQERKWIPGAHIQLMGGGAQKALLDNLIAALSSRQSLKRRLTT